MKRKRKNKELPNEQKRTRFRRWKSKKVWAYSAVALTMFGQLVSLHPVRGNAIVEGSELGDDRFGLNPKYYASMIVDELDSVQFTFDPAEMFAKTVDGTPYFNIHLFNNSGNLYAGVSLDEYTLSDSNWRIAAVTGNNENDSDVTKHYTEVTIVPGGTEQGRLNYYNSHNGVFTLSFPIKQGNSPTGAALQRHGGITIFMKINTSIDTDGDGLSDYEEFKLGTYPVGLTWHNILDNSASGVRDEYAKVTDFDKDGLKDGEEVHTYGTNPANDDTDGDGLLDGPEIAHGTDPGADDSDKDTDGDGLINGDEVKEGTDAFNSDTDGDGLSDGDEINTYHTDPIVDDRLTDTDHDGSTDAEELLNGTDPNNANILQFQAVPADLVFQDSTIPVTGEKIVYRQNGNWQFQIDDTRVNKTNFQVSVKETKVLTDDSGNQIKGALIYKDAAGEKTISDSMVTTIFEAKSAVLYDHHHLRWNMDEGILMKVAPGQVSAAGSYSGELEFSIDDVPTATP